MSWHVGFQQLTSFRGEGIAIKWNRPNNWRHNSYHTYKNKEMIGDDFYWEGRGQLKVKSCLQIVFWGNSLQIWLQRKLWQFINPKTVGCRKTCFYQALSPPENERMSTLKRDPDLRGNESSEPTIHFQEYSPPGTPNNQFKVDGNDAFQPFPM